MRPSNCTCHGQMIEAVYPGSGLWRFHLPSCPVIPTPSVVVESIPEPKTPAPSVGTDPRDQWYPGNDGVATVEELWAYYCARGEEIVESRAKIADLEAQLQGFRELFKNANQDRTWGCGHTGQGACGQCLWALENLARELAAFGRPKEGSDRYKAAWDRLQAATRQK